MCVCVQERETERKSLPRHQPCADIIDVARCRVSAVIHFNFVNFLLLLSDNLLLMRFLVCFLVLCRIKIQLVHSEVVPCLAWEFIGVHRVHTKRNEAPPLHVQSNESHIESDETFGSTSYSQRHTHTQKVRQYKKESVK